MSTLKRGLKSCRSLPANFTGPLILFHNNGEVSEHMLFFNGELDGPYRKFYTNGAVRMTGQYTVGEKTGMWMSFDHQGRLDSATKYSTATEWWY